MKICVKHYPSKTTVKTEREKAEAEPYNPDYCDTDTAISNQPQKSVTVSEAISQTRKMSATSMMGLKDSKKAQYWGSCFFLLNPLPPYKGIKYCTSSTNSDSMSSTFRHTICNTILKPVLFSLAFNKRKGKKDSKVVKLSGRDSEVHPCHISGIKIPKREVLALFSHIISC